MSLGLLLVILLINFLLGVFSRGFRGYGYSAASLIVGFAAAAAKRNDVLKDKAGG